MQALLEHLDLDSLSPHLVTARQPRHRAAWLPALSAAVAQSAGEADPPLGVGRADWERVLYARGQEANVTVVALRHAGPWCNLISPWSAPMRC
ncbi:MAG: hypothetical protein MI924_17385 [Chloroflexales bacterium]|nr:hypothetical protein [Chloroflexales bacterium]